jgi:uncharacterized membrane protein YqiK
MDTMGETIEILFIPIVVVIVVLVALWHRHAFILRIKRGTPRVVKGKVAGPFLEEVTDVCRAAGIQRGWVGGMRRGKCIVLAFSWHFPMPVKQRLRNLWVIHA